MSLINHPNIIQETLLYFARFPVRDNVLARFRKRQSEHFTDYYNTMRDTITNWADGNHSLCPAIDDLVFSSNEDAIKKQIEDMDGRMYMFLDYGQFQGNEAGNAKRKEQTFELAITVAQQWKPDDIDMFEHAALSDKTLNAVRCIAAQLVADQATCSGSEQILQYPFTLVPFYAREWQNSIGWTLAFNQWKIDWI